MPFLKKPRIFRVLVVLLYTLGLTWFGVNTSFKMGRLSNVPNYDDVTYFASATDLVQSLKLGGLHGGAEFFSRDTLHSPYSIGLAALAYWVGGFNDAAPYAANGILVLAYLSGIAYFLRKCDTLSFCLVLWMFMMIPFATMAVAEFRPDVAWATATGFAVVFALTREDFLERRRISAAFGVLVGMGLLIKPSTFVMTIFATGAAFGGRWLVEFARTNRQTALRALLPSLLSAGGCAVLIASPYYFFHGMEIWTYFFEGSFGKVATIFTTHGSRLYNWLFYLTGQGAQSNLGRQSWIFICISIALGAWHFKLSALVARLQAFFLALILATVFCITATAVVKSPFLGGAIYGTLIFSTAYFAGELLPRLLKPCTGVPVPGSAGEEAEARVPLFHSSVPLKSLLHGLLAILAVVTIFTYRWPDYSRWFKTGRNLGYVQVNTAIDDYLATVPVPKSILLTQGEPVVPENVRIWYLRRGKWVHQDISVFVESVTEFKALIKKNDLIIAQDKGVVGEGGYVMPAEALQDEFVNVLKNDDDFHLAKTIPMTAGKNVYVFARNQ